MRRTVLLSIIGFAAFVALSLYAPRTAPVSFHPVILTTTPATPAAIWFDPAQALEIDWVEVSIRIGEDFAGDVCLEAVVTGTGESTDLECTSWATD